MFRALSLDSYGKVSPEEKRSREPIGTFPNRGRSTMRKGSRDTDGNVLSLDTDIVNEQSNESTVEAAKVGPGNKGAFVDFSVAKRIEKTFAKRRAHLSGRKTRREKN